MVEGFRTQDQLAGLDEAARVHIAGRLGAVLAEHATPVADRQAAELLAHDLATDAIGQVQCALAEAIKNASHLPRPLAMMLAHDVGSVACPFLEVTDDFSETDWQSLILTISRTRESRSPGVRRWRTRSPCRLPKSAIPSLPKHLWRMLPRQ